MSSPDNTLLPTCRFTHPSLSEATGGPSIDNMNLQKLQDEIAKLSPQDRSKLRTFLNFLDAAPAALAKSPAPSPVSSPVPASVPTPDPAPMPKASPKPAHVNRAAHAGAAVSRAAALERLKAARRPNS